MGSPRDGREFPAPRGNGFYSQSLYYRLLNCGLRIPPSAGSASGVLPNPVGYNRAYVHLDGPFSYEAWWRGLGAGRSFVTNGPILLVEADGRHPARSSGRRAASRGWVSVAIRVLGDDPLEAVEVIRDGVVVERLAGADLGERMRAGPLVFASSGWFLVRAIAAVTGTFRFASTAPFYVEIGEGRETIHRDDVAFFLRWIDERIATLQRDAKGQLGDPRGRRRCCGRIGRRDCSSSGSSVTHGRIEYARQAPPRRRACCCCRPGAGPRSGRATIRPGPGRRPRSGSRR